VARRPCNLLQWFVPNLLPLLLYRRLLRRYCTVISLSNGLNAVTRAVTAFFQAGVRALTVVKLFLAAVACAALLQFLKLPCLDCRLRHTMCNE